jgi:F-type H+-transporting ATPase subunit a
LFVNAPPALRTKAWRNRRVVKRFGNKKATYTKVIKNCKKLLVKFFTMRQFFTPSEQNRSFNRGTRVLSRGGCYLMQRIFAIVFAIVLAGLPLGGFCAEGAPQAAPVLEHAEEGLPAHAGTIGHIGAFPITNSMLVTWIVALALIIFAQLATRNMKEVPSGLQNFWEWMVESLHKFLEGIIGHELVNKTFWFFATIFIFIIFCNWAGLIPGLGTIGWGHRTPEGYFDLTDPLFRGGNADLNMTLAMALIFFACWIIWSLQMNGPIGFLKHLFAPKGETTGFLKVLMVIVFFMVGWLEILSILFRPVSLSFRLYGNIFAGENMLETMSRLVPGFGWALPIPFYFMELLVGFVQALVFMLLTAVFTMLMAPHDEASHGKAHH